jgi:hypothetical protein
MKRDGKYFNFGGTQVEKHCPMSNSLMATKKKGKIICKKKPNFGRLNQ